HVHPWVVDRIHPDTIAQQCAAGLSFGWIHRNDAYRLAVEIDKKSSHQFVDNGRFASAACSGDTQYGCRGGFGPRCDGVKEIAMVIVKIFSGGYELRYGQVIRGGKVVCKIRRDFLTCRMVALLHEVVDHALQSHSPAVIR